MKVSSIESCCLAASQLHDVSNIAFRIVKLINRFSHWKWQIFTDIYILLSVRGIRMTLLWWYAGRYLAIYLHIILVHLNRLWFIWFTFHRLSISLKRRRRNEKYSASFWYAIAKIESLNRRTQFNGAQLFYTISISIWTGELSNVRKIFI